MIDREMIGRWEDKAANQIEFQSEYPGSQLHKTELGSVEISATANSFHLFLPFLYHPHHSL